ncbi:PH domain-containing protein [Balamuthia mandrillaris]
MSLKGISVASLTNPEKEGWLTKQGGSYKSWKKRWCVLKDGTVFYFKNPKATTPKGTIDLEPTSQVTETTLTKKKFAFQVKTAQRTFVIYADSDSIKASWVSALQSAVESLKAGASRGGGASYSTTSSSAGGKENTEANGTGERGAEPKPEKAPKESKKTAGDAVAPRTLLSLAKDTIPFLQEEDSKVLEFWQIWSESIPSTDDLSGPMSIEFHVSTSADMQKLTWRTAGPQNIFIQRMVDFFWNVGAPESEIDRLNDVGALINPVKIGSWIDMSGKGGMDGGWYFPVDIPIKLALEAADSGDAATKVGQWAEKHHIENCISVGRDMGAAPPRQTELRINLPGNPERQVEVALDAFQTFDFPPLPEDAVAVLRRAAKDQNILSIITSSEGFVRLGMLIPQPAPETVLNLCSVCGASTDELASFEGALGSEGPAWAEYQYLKKDFGYGVYKEGFDVVFHYSVGEERGTDE